MSILIVFFRKQGEPGQPGPPGLYQLYLHFISLKANLSISVFFFFLLGPPGPIGAQGPIGMYKRNINDGFLYFLFQIFKCLCSRYAEFDFFSQIGVAGIPGHDGKKGKTHS